MKEAMYYTKDNTLIYCQLCPHGCMLREDQVGLCNARQVKDGKLLSLNYAAISSAAIDPIEKKPLYHFKPGKSILSLGSFGCNFKCGFCQNYSISRQHPNTQYFDSRELVTLANSKIEEGNIGIAFTYNEPSIWFEYIYDVINELKRDNLRNKLSLVMVTNGYINEDPLKTILPNISAMNIDLKAFKNDFYKNTCGGNLEKVKNSIVLAHKHCHIEITTLLVNGFNDSDKEIEELCAWLSSIDINIPLHLNQYHPTYKFSAPPTPLERIESCRDIAKRYLNYVYVGNIPGEDINTYCPNCNNLLIERNHYQVKNLLNNNNCPSCNSKINIIL